MPDEPSGSSRIVKLKTFDASMHPVLSRRYSKGLDIVELFTIDNMEVKKSRF
jgi:hypothetical protein